MPEDSEDNEDSEGSMVKKLELHMLFDRHISELIKTVMGMLI